MKLQFSENAWDDYLYWQKTDRNMLKRINALIQDIQRSSFDGIGKALAAGDRAPHISPSKYVAVKFTGCEV